MGLLVQVDIDDRDVAMAKSPEEILSAFRYFLAVYHEADFEAGDIDASTDEPAFFGTRVPGEVEMPVVSDAVLGSVCLENIVRACDSAFIVVDEVTQA